MKENLDQSGHSNKLSFFRLNRKVSRSSEECRSATTVKGNTGIRLIKVNLDQSGQLNKLSFFSSQYKIK